jgi:hypothetical protein
MSDRFPRPSRRYTFDLELEVDRSFAFAAGDLAELLGEGMITLDHAGLMFPGVSLPPTGRLLLNVSVQATGFARGGIPAPADPQATKPTKPAAGRRQKRDGIVEQLDSVIVWLGPATLRQRILLARLMAIWDELPGAAWVGHPGPERDAVKQVVDAAERLITLSDELLDPIFGPYPP